MSSVSGFQFSVRPRSPGKICQREPSSSSTMCLSEWDLIFLAWTLPPFFQRFQVRQPGHDKLLSVGLARRQLTENVVGERLACLNGSRCLKFSKTAIARSMADGATVVSSSLDIGYRYLPACGHCSAKLRP